MDDSSEETNVERTVSGLDLGPRSNPLPWVLFGITAAVLTVLTFVLLRQVSSQRERANSEANAHVKETAHAEAAEQALAKANGQVQSLELQVKTLSEDRDNLEAKVKALEAGAATKPAPPPALGKKSATASKKTGKKTGKKTPKSKPPAKKKGR